MNPELGDKLVKDFPLTFNGHDSFYFECGDGWEPLLRITFEKIEPLIQKMADNVADKEFMPSVSQVKEKFGTLRIYMHFADDEIFEIINKAGIDSEYICEMCSKQGHLVGKGWHKNWHSVRCDECFNREIEKANKCL